MCMHPFVIPLHKSLYITFIYEDIFYRNGKNKLILHDFYQFYVDIFTEFSANIYGYEKKHVCKKCWPHFKK